MQKVKSAGIPRAVVKGTSSNTAQSLSDLGATVEVSQAGSITAQSEFATVSVETNAVRVSLGTPTAAVGHLLQPGDSVDLQGNEEVLTAKFISAVAGAHGALQITTEF
jgi:hypothetical protein